MLTLTRIFPNRLEPHSAPFNRQQLGALQSLADVRVVAPIPWFPGVRWLRRWSAAGRLQAVPRRDRIAGFDVAHPRVPYAPRVGHAVDGPLYAARMVPHVASAPCDVLFATWAYPDGWAAIALGALFGLPVVVKLHGSDVNVVARMPGPRRMLRWMLPRADRVIAVSRALRDEAIALGVAPERVDVVRNGVDRERFSPRDQSAARDRLGLSRRGRIALYVGRLDRAKGIHELIDAFESLGDRGDDRLVMVGDGPERRRCEAAAERSGGRIVLTGKKSHDEIPDWLSASDLLVLPSWNEGTPNVVLEALASGRRVVATRVGGIPEIVDARCGTLVDPGATPALARALDRELSTSDLDPRAVVAAAPVGSWQESARSLHASLVRAVTERGAVGVLRGVTP